MYSDRHKKERQTKVQTGTERQREVQTETERERQGGRVESEIKRQDIHFSVTPYKMREQVERFPC